jgi:hypothetical protein
MNRPGWFNRFLYRLRGGAAQPAAAASPRPAQQVAASPARLPPPVTVKVGLVIIDPLVPGGRGQHLVSALGWNDPDRLVAGLAADLAQVSHGYAKYEVAERVVSAQFPVKADGFRYTADSYLRAWQNHSGFHMPDDIDYHALLEQFEIIPKINAGMIDEVWTVSVPYAVFYESRMAGPGAFWCNAPPLDAPQASRRFVVMGFNYERGVGEMLESYGHRAESILMRVWGDDPRPGNLWKQYTLYDKIAPGRAEVGNIHFAPNSRQDYEWGSHSPVLSRCRNWASFPDLSGAPVMVDCREWGGGDMRLHHRWWFNSLPHIQGETGGIANNWWQYIVDPNLAR